MKRKAEQEAQWDFVAAASWIHKKRKRTRYCDSTSTLLPSQSEGQRGKPTLVLDMDRTLIFSCTDNVILKFGGKSASIPVSRVAKRPGVDEFLQQMARVYEIVVFTCGIKQYADSILDKLDPEGKLISHRLYRDSCTLLEGKRTKDLSRLGRDMKKVVILDDKRKSFCLNPGTTASAIDWDRQRSNRHKTRCDNKFVSSNIWNYQLSCKHLGIRSTLNLKVLRLPNILFLGVS